MHSVSLTPLNYSLSSPYSVPGPTRESGDVCGLVLGGCGWLDKAGFIDEQVKRKGNEEKQGEPWPGWLSG